MRENNRTTQSWSCIYCRDRKIFASEPTLWEHAEAVHHNELASALNKNIKIDPRRAFAEECAQKKYVPRSIHPDMLTESEPRLLVNRMAGNRECG